MNIETIDNIDFLYALEVINNPSLEETEDFQRWIVGSGNQELYNELKLYREAEQVSSVGLPSSVISEQLKLLRGRVAKRKARTRRLIISCTAGVASVAAVVILFLNIISSTEKIPVEYISEFVAQETPQQVTLQIDDAEPVPIGESSATSKNTINSNISDSIINVGRINSISIPHILPEKIHTLKMTIPRGQMYTIILSDGTQVCLNTGSSLKYPSQFGSDSRVVELSGEAYFKVTKDAARPFIVKTDYMVTRVLGTEFNVRAYNEKDASVTLVSGKVEVESGDKARLSLNPNECAMIKASKLQVQTVDVKKYTAWVDGYFYFDNASLEDIMKELGRWYNINIEFANKSTKEYKYKFWADRNGSLEDAVDLLNEYGKASIIVQNKRLIIYK